MLNGPLYSEGVSSLTIATARQSTCSFSTTLIGITENDTQILEAWIQNIWKELQKTLDSRKAKTVILSLNVSTSDDQDPK